MVSTHPHPPLSIPHPLTCASLSTENLFASKLRRTSSLPVLSFDALTRPAAPHKPPTRSSTLGALGRPKLPKLKERASASRGLLGMLEEEAETGSTLSASATASGALAGGKGKGRETTALAGRSFERTWSAVSGRSDGGSGRASMFSRASAGDSLAAAAAQRQAAAASKLKRKASALLLDQSDEEDGDYVPASPTLSVATTFAGADDDDDPAYAYRGGSRRGSSSLAVPGAAGGGGGGGGGARGLSRVTSVGALSFSRGRSREPSAAPSVEPDSVEGRNKNAVKKVVLARLTGRGVDREDARFAGVFTVTSKGVQFALVSRARFLRRVIAARRC